MSQQFTEPTESQQYQPQQSQQYQPQQSQFQQGGQQDGGRLPQQYRQSLDVVAQAVQVCGWCADQCIKKADPMMVECIRMCEDVVELGETLLAVAPRSSYVTADVALTFAEAAQACARECSRHEDAHCQECASVLPQAARSAQQLTTIGGQQQAGGQQQTGGQQQAGGQQLSM